MADSQHLEIAKLGVHAWNAWRNGDPSAVSHLLHPPAPDSPADFSDHDFREDPIDFSGFQFGHHADFSGSVFGDKTQFPCATFLTSPRFVDCRFGDQANFQGTDFGFEAVFDGARFGVRACFDGATFDASARFFGARFGSGASFRGTFFRGWTYFKGASFDANASFEGWDGEAVETFAKRLERNFQERFDPAMASRCRSRIRAEKRRHWLPEISFAYARFGPGASFASRALRGTLDLSQSQFEAPPALDGLGAPERVDPTGMKVYLGTRSKWWPRTWTKDSSTVTAVRRLRKLAAEIHHHDWERDLFILERQGERGGLWASFWRAFWDSGRSGHLETLKLLWQAATHTILIFLYWASADFGRSVLRPLAWLFAVQIGFYAGYAAETERPGMWDAKAAAFTLAQAVPFLPTAKTATNTYIDSLPDKLLPVGLQLASITQGLLSALFVFLALLAVRNFFRVK